MSLASVPEEGGLRAHLTPLSQHSHPLPLEALLRLFPLFSCLTPWGHREPGDESSPLLLWGGCPPFFILGLYLMEGGTVCLLTLGRLLPYPTLLWGPGEDENWLGDK